MEFMSCLKFYIIEVTSDSRIPFTMFVFFIHNMTVGSS